MDTKNIPYRFHDTVVVRTPAYPLRLGATAAEIFDFFKAGVPKEALYLASPVLFHEYQKWLDGKPFPEKEKEKLLYALTRYYYRMRTRCTPFGLLATVSTTGWAEGESRIVLGDLDQVERRNRLDMFATCNIQEKLMAHPDVLQHLTFFPNASIYQVGDDIRYIEYKPKGELRSHEITSVQYSEYLELILNFSRKGVRLRDIADMLVPHEIEWEEGFEFAQQLVEAQILVSEMDPNTTGEHFFDRIIRILGRIRDEAPSPFVSAWFEVLEQIKTKITSLDGPPQNHFPVYQEILHLLEKAGMEALETKLCQADAWRPLDENALSQELQEKFKRLLWFLNKLTPFKAPESWQKFVQKFTERYENEEVPILRVLDDELGLGFGNSVNQDDNPISKDVLVPNESAFSTTEWTNEQSKILNLLLDTYANKDVVLNLSAGTFGSENPSWDLLPPSFSIIFRMVAEGKIWVETVGNASGANLVGRFAYLKPALLDLVQDICAQEQQLNDNVIFAEIVHLPGSRVGNILLRPAVRQYEIPFLAQSSVDAEFQLPLDDLFVSVFNGRIVLRSRRLNKFIIPKLTTAHNYHYYTQPLYKFLCDLQNQDFRFWMTFSLSDLGNQMVFTPRVEFENFILSPATWYLTNDTMAGVLKAKDETTRMAEMAALRARFNMPRYLSLLEADIEMIVDTEDPLLVSVLASDARIRAQIVLREYLGDPDSVVKDRQHQAYANQFFITLLRNTPIYTHLNPLHQLAASAALQRVFVPGDQWVYYKAYSGVKTTDNLLIDIIQPIAQHLKAQGMIDRWFFIRYNDPDNHIRFRFHLSEQRHFQYLTELVNQQFRAQLADGTVWKIQLDSYRREIERYGANTMELSELLFDADSTATAFFLGKMREEQSPDIRWLWAMKTTDLLLHQLGYSPEQKINLLGSLKQSFAREFRMDNALYLKQLSRNFREHKDRIRELMQAEPGSGQVSPDWLAEALLLHQQAIEAPCRGLLEVAQQQALELPLDMLVASYIHMKFNRIFPSYQRKNEMVFYDFLYQSFKSAQFLLPAEA
ncbi:MAG: lantibiotic dehydratase [Saprospiraceae bacterium]|nr:lantibiotic dehydratase [Saprospiraceae bacterium]